MSKIKFTDLGYNIVLMDVTVGKEYEITRFLNEGDITHSGCEVPANMPGVEFLDDAGDFVAFAFGFAGTKHHIFTEVH